MLMGSIIALTAISVNAETEKPYLLIEGKISENAIEGWKTYNGGGCGGCHGPGGKGAVAPSLDQSVKQKPKETFVDAVTNGVRGTFMKPHKTNKRVMKNLDNLYAYLMARGDGVLGEGNLIKHPLGKIDNTK
ncbi:MAG: mono/diheme cytochrome c family protein [Gammaproteobacteria bacterium]|jgi:mono/diheme cytochrome c family protein